MSVYHGSFPWRSLEYGKRSNHTIHTSLVALEEVPISSHETYLRLLVGWGDTEPQLGKSKIRA